MRLAIKHALAAIATVLLALACSKEPIPVPTMGGTDIFETTTVPEVHIEVPLSEWNSLLSAYDKDAYTAHIAMCNVRYVDERGEVNVNGAGFRLHGNYSRVRPEGYSGQKHTTNKTNWNHFHFILNLGAFHDDSEHEIHGADKLLFKWFHEDPTYVREIYSYDLFHRDNIWTAADATYAKIYFHVEGDRNEVYYGVYSMIEPVDHSFIKRRRHYFKNTDGFLWKCRLGASLNNFTADRRGIDDNIHRYQYTLKTGTEDYNIAVEQMTDFTTKLKTLSGEEFNIWIAKVCDVDFLLRTYAVNVILGMWDDYWNNNNNYYLYFDSRDPKDYHVYLIPYDYDNSLGTCNSTGNVKNSGTADPFNWGLKSNKWISNILKNSNWREIYRQELLKLVDPEQELFDKTASQLRIANWQKSILKDIPNDTGEDCVLEDKPATWGRVGNYTLTGDKSTNFFTVRTKAIHTYCDKK